MTFRTLVQILRPISLVRPVISEKLPNINYEEKSSRRNNSPSISSNKYRDIGHFLSTYNTNFTYLPNNISYCPSQQIFANNSLNKISTQTKVNGVLCRSSKNKPQVLFKSNDQVRHLSVVAHSKKYTSEKLRDLRQKVYSYSRRFKSKRSSKKKKSIVCKCKAPQALNCPKLTPKFTMKHCAKPYRKDCEPKDIICKPRLESPYGCYSECMSDWYEGELSECVNYNEIFLQPRKQVSRTIETFLAPPPKWAPINPAIERKCIKNQPCTPPPILEDDEEIDWKNPCPQFKLRFCKKRARQFCGFPKPQKCKKLEAPYPSFTDYCPQFPDVALSECDVAEKLKNESKIYYSGKSMEIMIEKVEFPEPEDPCNPKKKKSGICIAPRSPKCRQEVKGNKACDPIDLSLKKTECKKCNNQQVCVCKCTSSKSDKKMASKDSKKKSPKNIKKKSSTSIRKSSSTTISKNDK